MNDGEVPANIATGNRLWGSDRVAGLLRELGIEFIALTARRQLPWPA